MFLSPAPIPAADIMRQEHRDRQLALALSQEQEDLLEGEERERERVFRVNRRSRDAYRLRTLEDDALLAEVRQQRRELLRRGHNVDLFAPVTRDELAGWRRNPHRAGRPKKYSKKKD